MRTALRRAGSGLLLVPTLTWLRFQQFAVDANCAHACSRSGARADAAASSATRASAASPAATSTCGAVILVPVGVVGWRPVATDRHGDANGSGTHGRSRRPTREQQRRCGQGFFLRDGAGGCDNRDLHHHHGDGDHPRHDDDYRHLLRRGAHRGPQSTLPLPRASFTVTSPTRGSDVCVLIEGGRELDCRLDGRGSSGVIVRWTWVLEARERIVQQRTDGVLAEIDTECRLVNGATASTDRQDDKYVDMTVSLEVLDRDGLSSSPSRRTIRLYTNSNCGF